MSAVVLALAAQVFSQTIANVAGIDASADTVQSIREKLGLRGLQGSLPHPDLVDGSFDVVTMMHSLEHVHQPLEVLRAAHRSRLLVAIEDHFQTGGLYSIVAEVMVRHGVLCRLQSISLGERWFKPALLADVLAHEGFTGPAIAGKVLAEVGELGALSILDETLVDNPGGRSHPAGR